MVEHAVETRGSQIRSLLQAPQDHVCNGSIAVSKTAGLGSNPSGPAIFLNRSFVVFFGWISKSGSKEAVCKTVGSRLRRFKSCSTHHAWIAQLVERAVETRGSQIRFLLQAP